MTHRAAFFFLAVLALAAPLSACGKKGPLKAPPEYDNVETTPEEEIDNEIEAIFR